jgi:hypothetical protein
MKVMVTDLSRGVSSITENVYTEEIKMITKNSGGFYDSVCTLPSSLQHECVIELVIIRISF